MFQKYFILFCALYTVSGKHASAPSSDFTTHRIVRPTFHHGRTKREISTTKESNGNHHPEVTLTVSIDGEQYVLELRLNEDLVPSGHVLSYQEKGETKLHTPTREDLDICQYSGRVRGRRGSWAAVSTCHGVKGVIYDGHQMRYIQPVQDNDINADHFLYSHEHLAKEHKCGYEGGATLNSSYDPLLFQQRSQEQARRRSRVSRYKRDTHEDIRVREPYNANKLSRYVELVLVADRGSYLASGQDLRALHRQLTDIVNIINSVYAPLNIFIALVGVVVWTERDAIELEEDSSATLDNFVRYRRNQLVHQIPNDNSHLLTKQRFKGGVIGIAQKGESVICSRDYSAGVASYYSEVLGLVALTTAHEMGHNFNMNHDNYTTCACPGEGCIMNPYSRVGQHHWSTCSLKSLALWFESGNDHCLRNQPKTLFNSPTCGNGFLEEGEQCDCGTAPGEYAPQDGGAACHACCRADCTLRANATCGHGQCCDLTTCRPKPAGAECRAAERECDLPEYCSGHSQFCPGDVHKMDATPCGDGPLKMCWKQRCVAAQWAQASLPAKEGSVCPSTCSGNGVCNSEGNCHCQPGFAPPLCALPGAGGSYDSGPATDTSVQRNFMVAMYVIFLGIIPSTLLLLCLIYYLKNNVLPFWKNPSNKHLHTVVCSGKDTNPTKADLNIFNKFSKFNKYSVQQLSNNFNNSGPTENVAKSNLIIDDKSTYANVASVIKSGGTPSVVTNNNDLVSSKIVNLNKSKVKEPVRFNRKINKEDIVIVENCSNNTNTPSVNVNTIKKVESKIKIDVFTSHKSNFELPKNDKGPSSLKLPEIAPKPSVSPKPSVKPRPNACPSEKPNPNIINTGLTTNAIVNQRAKLKKINNSLGNRQS